MLEYVVKDDYRRMKRIPPDGNTEIIGTEGEHA